VQVQFYDVVPEDEEFTQVLIHTYLIDLPV
jgi:hypothetical protein